MKFNNDLTIILVFTDNKILSFQLLISGQLYPFRWESPHNLTDLIDNDSFFYLQELSVIFHTFTRFFYMGDILIQQVIKVLLNQIQVTLLIIRQHTE